MKFPWRNRTIYMLPNRYGIALFGIFFVFVLAGAAYTNNLVFMLGFLVLSFAFTAIMQTARTIRNLDSLSINIYSQPAGTNTSARIAVRNPTHQYKPKLLVEIPDLGARIQISDLQPQEIRTVTFSSQLPNQRGVYSIKKIRVSSLAPYGMFRAWMYIKVADQFIVYPKLRGRADLPLQLDNSGESFSGHRPFISGDNYSRVDWKIYARTQNTYIKEYKEASTKKVLIDWDKINIPNFEDRISQIALWVDQAHKQHVEFGIRIPGFETTVQSGYAHYHECMKELSVIKL